MSGKPLDLKNLVMMIATQKDFEAEYSMDQGCSIETEDPKPLVKVINYMLNFISQNAPNYAVVSLELRDKFYKLSFIGNSDSPIAALSLNEQIADVLKSYNATCELIIDREKSLRLEIEFGR